MSMLPFLPLRTYFGGYSKAEEELRASNTRLDAAFIPLFGAWYLFLAYIVKAIHGESQPVPPPGQATTLLVMMLLAVVGACVLTAHSQATPTATSDTEAFYAQRHFGQWIYLTRHCLTLQAWHQIFTLLAWGFPTLAALTTGMTLLIATLAWFVTIQYFALVVNTDGFKEEVKVWSDRGVQFEEIMAVIHVPPLPTSLLDLFFRSPESLQLGVSLQATLMLVAAYVLIYLAVIMGNFSLTQKWPYHFLNELGTDVSKWAMFVVQQCGVLLLFCAVNWILLQMLLPTAPAVQS